MSRKIKIAIAFALALVMSIGLVATVVADYVPVTGTPTNPARAAITKILSTPEGTPIPSNMTFNFVVTSVSLNGLVPTDTDFPTGITLPQLGTAGAVSIPVSDANMTTTGGITTRIMETNDLLAGISWPSTGIFEFSIVETANFLPYVQNLDPDLVEEYIFSQAQFTLRAHIGVHEGVRYVRYTYALVVLNDDGTPGSGKVDPTDGTENTQGEHSQVMFNNSYWVTDDGGGTDEGPLVVSKTVTGNNGDDTFQFTFNATLNLDTALFPTPVPFVAYIYDADDDRVSGPHNFTRGSETTFQLRHNERLVFQNTPVGTQFVVTETAVNLYQTSIVVNGVNIPGPDGLSTGDRLVLATGSTAAFTNHNEATPPTGIALDNLPFIGMIALAIGGLVTFIVVKVKKSRSDYSYEYYY